jgi:DNA-binding PadR family transcriptional regulator
LIVWALLAKEGAAAFQNELRPEPEKSDREALNSDGLIDWEKRGQRIWVWVTEKGWAWAADHLDAKLPNRSPAGSEILRAWLTRLGTFMKARDFALADILAPQPPAAPRPLDYPVVRERIREAYLEVTGGRLNARALLRDLREKLKDIDRAAVDDALRRMHLEQGATLSGLNNPLEITPAIRRDGLDFKGVPMFALWITK